MAQFNVLAAQPQLPKQPQIMWWEQGLKEDTKAQCSVDPLTHLEFTDIRAAQSSALGLDAH